MEQIKPEQRGKERPLDKELLAVLEQIDFKVLEQVFSSTIRDLGLDPKELTFVPLDRIHGMGLFDQLRGRTGVYHPEEQEIVMGKTTIEMGSHFRKTRSEAPPFNESVLSTLCHEETHAVSHQTCSDWEETSVPFLEKRYQEIGYMQKPAARVFGSFTVYPEAGFAIFNEGVTDMIGEDVFYKYLNSAPEDSLAAEQYLTLYPTARKLVNSVINKISGECELPRELVWRSLQRGYFTGEDLSGDTMKRLFADIAPDALFENVRKAGGEFSVDIALALQKIEKTTWDDKTRTRVRRWFNHLDTVMNTSAQE